MDKKYFFFLGVQHPWSLGKYTLKHFWDNLSPSQSSCLSSRNITTNAGENVGREEILLTGGGGVQISTAVVELNWENAPQ